ncbi:hypothetical protein GCM10009759_05000 [Kitasatospora saccharophila]|uniref:Excreted virulence factor EspC (Type VII ESX diderm) n=1 Tax=Kitasatospora saccharophila TaxID=407973 RepID=A0ABN2W6X6_9ACTN
MDHEALEECGRKLGRAGDDLETAGSGLECLGVITAARVGDYGVADAADNFFGSWRDERLLNVEALYELADRVRQSAANYRDTDEAVAGSLHRTSY